jgi:hypothetical protein
MMVFSSFHQFILFMGELCSICKVLSNVAVLGSWRDWLFIITSDVVAFNEYWL